MFTQLNNKTNTFIMLRNLCYTFKLSYVSKSYADCLNKSNKFGGFPSIKLI